MYATDRDLAEVVCVRVNPGIDQEWDALRNLSLVGSCALNQEKIACNNEAKIDVMKNLDTVYDDRRGEAPGKRRIYEKMIATGSLV